MATIRLNTADLKALAKTPDARKNAIYLVDTEEPEQPMPASVIVCDADMVLGPVLEVIQYLAGELLAARSALDLRGRAKAAVERHVYDDYLEDGETVEQRLMRAVRDAERLAVLEEQGRATVPGSWRCVTCGFTVQKMILRASDGAIGVSREEVQDVCPNDGTSLRPTTWQEEAEGAIKVAVQQMERAATLQADVERRQRWATTGRW